MVESIFGGKATGYPLGCYERNVFHARLAERRLSVQSAQLKTISETGDDNVPSDRASAVQVFENIVSEGPSCYRRPRTMSLPAIYRDGSYLRIKRSTNAPISCQKRRYSEPAGMTSQKIIHRLSLRPNDSYSVSDESENASCKRPSVTSEGEAACTARKSSFQDILMPRRHSDPMCFVTEQVKKLEISRARRERSPRKVVPIAVTSLSVCGQNKPQTKTDSQQARARVSARRRKSSLVPVPFSSPVQDTQKARHNQPSSRPLSFPPSKQEGKRHCNLPALNMKSRFLTRHVSSENEGTTIECDYNNNSGRVDEQPLESDDTKDVEDKYIANEAILVQWMKFFG